MVTRAMQRSDSLGGCLGPSGALLRLQRFCRLSVHVACSWVYKNIQRRPRTHMGVQEHPKASKNIHVMGTRGRAEAPKGMVILASLSRLYQRFCRYACCAPRTFVRARPEPEKVQALRCSGNNYNGRCVSYLSLLSHASPRQQAAGSRQQARQNTHAHAHPTHTHTHTRTPTCNLASRCLKSHGFTRST
jgi:hypothetical protein